MEAYIQSYDLDSVGALGFNILDKDFTIETFIKPDTGTTMTANQSLFAKHARTNDNNYTLRLVGANSNVGFVVNDGGTITELYGGNANGGVNLHVAVSYEKNVNNLRLYVNNVKVAHKNMTATNFDGNVIIGSNSNSASEGERFSGLVEFTRLSHAAKYRSGGISPLKSLSLHLTNINSSYGLAPFIDYKKLWDENEIK